MPARRRCRAARRKFTGVARCLAQGLHTAATPTHTWYGVHPKRDGCTVTIDAIGCQREVAEKIVGQGGDYQLALKANQGKLFEVIAEFYAEGQRHGFGSLAVSRFETLEKDHGRIETRRHVWVGKQGWIEPSLRDDWKNLAGVGMVERQREVKGKVSVERT